MKLLLLTFLVTDLAVVGIIPTEQSSGNSAGAIANKSISAVSLNLAKERDFNAVLRAIRGAPSLRDADIFLFQEVVHKDSGLSIADQVAKSLGYTSAFAASAPNVYDQGLAIVSRYPLTAFQVKRLKPFLCCFPKPQPPGHFCYGTHSMGRLPHLECSPRLAY